MKNILKSKLKVLFVLIAVTAGSLLAAQPQDGRQQGPPPIPNAKQIKAMVSDLADEISLTEKQEEQVLKLHTHHFAEIKNKTKSGRPDRSEMQKLKTDFETKVKAVLTEDQQKLYTTYLKNNRPPKGVKQRKH